MNAIKVGIIGITGYAGEELIKILFQHPGIEIKFLSSRFDKPKKKLSEIYSNLKNIPDIDCTSLDIDNNLKESELKNTDVVFLALPHGTSAQIAKKVLKAGKKVIDLSADFRLKNPATYKKYYELEHPCPELLKEAVYGLPELYKTQISKAKLIANPGCYPTSVILGSMPLLKNKLVKKTSIIIDSKSGYSGAGREFVKKYLAAGLPNTFAYKTGGKHRHIPEMEQELSLLTEKPEECKIIFTPHVVPQERGMYSVLYFEILRKISLTEIASLYKTFYKDEPFVRVLGEGKEPQTINVTNTNFCDIGFALYESKNILIVMSALDNLVKGASGQAVQNMNLLYGLDEKTGLQ
ncbi:MAG: N-acetyl-gamma-glutamyl-phosphate reductase [Elusimicrobia bacterium]|nr:N-acetyl-gamma-glutamyl-phosphate reductase [Elusimicrobiota bacterium]MBU2614715.1 N-acetyl-gamma-glutamyl-phosphate reductase [Elusimicrobiota bacterium]